MALFMAGGSMNYIHPKLRKYQAETLEQIQASQARFIIIRGPTGSGKSFYAAQLAAWGNKVLTLVSTKSLQAQYQDAYSFEVLYGKSNYDCYSYKLLNPNDLTTCKSGLTTTADLCPIRTGDKAYICCAGSCPYPIEKQTFLRAKGGCLNYAKFLLDTRLSRAFSPQYLFLDEAHELKRVVINFSGLEISFGGWINEYTDGILIDKPQPIARKMGVEYLQQLLKNLKTKPQKHPQDGGKPKKYKWWERSVQELETTLDHIRIEPACWFVHSDKWRFVCKPLTARYHFTNLFDIGQKIVLMSATIKPRDIQALGIDDYEFISVPNSIPASMRPIYDLRTPEIKASTSYQDKKTHARLIARPFLEHEEWNGLVHVTSEKMAQELGGMLSDLTKRPIWIGEKGTGTNEAYDSWNGFLLHNPNAVAVTWQFMTGMDGQDININITARTPYPNFGDSFEKAMFNYNPGDARVDVTNLMEQQQGRNRRGYDSHYGPEAAKYNGIADGKWSKLKSAFSKDFLEAVR